MLDGFDVKMAAYSVEDLIAIFRDNDSLSTDGYMNFCRSVEGVQYIKRDFLYRSGTWRNAKVKSYFRDQEKSTEVLVLGHSDYPTRVHDLLLIRAFGVHSVLAINCTPIQGLSQCLPLGLTNYCNDSVVHPILGLTSPFIEILKNRTTPTKFQNSVLMAFITQSADKYRAPVYAQFVNCPDVTTFAAESLTNERRLVYLQSINEHDFVLCPRGNGRDTHRLWETLYLGSIPIVKNGELPEQLLSDFPVWIVNEWSEALNPDLRASAREKILARDWDVTRLRQSFWNSVIASHLA